MPHIWKILLVAIALINGSAFAHPACDPIAAPGKHRFATGEYIGVDTEDLPPDAVKSTNCYMGPEIEALGHEPTCEFVDSMGITYFMQAGYIIRADIKKEDIGKATPLPFGLQLNATMAEAIQQIRTQGNIPYEVLIYAEHRYSSISLGTHYCLQNKHGTPFSFDISFDENGRLSEITTQLLWEGF